MTSPKRRKDDNDIADRADALIAKLDEAVKRLEAILIGEPHDHTED